MSGREGEGGGGGDSELLIVFSNTNRARTNRQIDR